MKNTERPLGMVQNKETWSMQFLRMGKTKGNMFQKYRKGRGGGNNILWELPLQQSDKEEITETSPIAIEIL